MRKINRATARFMPLDITGMPGNENETYTIIGFVEHEGETYSLSVPGFLTWVRDEDNYDADLWKWLRENKNQFVGFNYLHDAIANEISDDDGDLILDPDYQVLSTGCFLLPV